MRQCQICQNPKLEEIENEINSGTMSVRGIARLYNLQHDALQRHATRHMGMPDITEADGNAEYNTLDEINRMLLRNKLALDTTKNPVQGQKLIQQQMDLMAMLEKENAKNIKNSNYTITDFSKLNNGELNLLDQLLRKAQGKQYGYIPWYSDEIEHDGQPLDLSYLGNESR